MSPRKPNMESSIYLGSDGWWHGRVTMGIKDGSPDRRHRRARTEAEIKRKVRELEDLRDKGRAPKASRKPTVEQWMTTYLTDIASLKLKPRSLDDYWSKTRNDIVPGIGKHKLDKLQLEHLERMYRVMLDEGHAPSHVVKVHRILSRALKIAHRRRINRRERSNARGSADGRRDRGEPVHDRAGESLPGSSGKTPHLHALVRRRRNGLSARGSAGPAVALRRLRSRVVPPPVAASAPHVAPRVQGRPRLRRASPPLRALPARLPHTQELQARLPQAGPEGLPETRQRLPRAQRRGSSLHPPQDQEEHEPRSHPAAVHPLPT